MDVFVYGTLCDADRAGSVLDPIDPDWEYLAPATLEGWHRVEGAYPTLAPGDEVRGRLLRTEAVDALDRYEGVDRGLYVRVEVPRTDGGRAATYVGDPAALGVPDEWPDGAGPLAERVRRHRREAGVVVRVDDRRS